MQEVGLADFVCGAGLYLMLASPSHSVGSLHLREHTLATTFAGQHRKHVMAGTVTPIYICEEPLSV